ncbi:hypothetical protein DUT91_23880 [Phyllobacterium salinisoli]|uniref:Uncharacterized protein n=1 Tax=Phyllobacterium salinisoli TaxID=1899321 RepID=A0A368JWY3_9HYPH|nr:hypothetical protein DUT91_23880 [Phyllobacterium salinisoli]
MNHEAIGRLVIEDGVPVERVAMAITLAKIASAALESDVKLLRLRGATDDELDAYSKRRNAELNDWLLA